MKRWWASVNAGPRRASWEAGWWQAVGMERRWRSCTLDEKCSEERDRQKGSVCRLEPPSWLDEGIRSPLSFYFFCLIHSLLFLGSHFPANSCTKDPGFLVWLCYPGHIILAALGSEISNILRFLTVKPSDSCRCSIPPEKGIFQIKWKTGVSWYGHLTLVVRSHYRNVWKTALTKLPGSPKLLRICPDVLTQCITEASTLNLLVREVQWRGTNASSQFVQPPPTTSKETTWLWNWYPDHATETPQSGRSSILSWPLFCHIDPRFPEH